MTTNRTGIGMSSDVMRTAVLVAAGIAGCLGSVAQSQELEAELATYHHSIVFESYRAGNWELVTVRADGSNLTNLTQTPEVNELYPHVSPDGLRIAFVVDEGEGPTKVRSVFTMNMDRTGRTLVARNARQECWNGDGTELAYLKSESDKFSYMDYATRSIFVYDLATGRHQAHPNSDIYHLYNLCRSPDKDWFVATVHAGMGYRHAILAIQANAPGVFNLDVHGCRPDISPDGKQIAWGASDWVLRIGDLDFSGVKPRIVNVRDVVKSSKPTKVYHIDWSPDGKYVAFSRGPEKKVMGRAPEIVGLRAKGWDICVADVTKLNRWVAITTDGNCNKEPDWIP